MPCMQAALMGLSDSLQSHITSVQCEGQEISLPHCNFTKLSAEDQTNQQRFTAAGVHCAGQLKYIAHLWNCGEGGGGG